MCNLKICNMLIFEALKMKCFPYPLFPPAVSHGFLSWLGGRSIREFWVAVTSTVSTRPASPWIFDVLPWRTAAGRQQQKRCAQKPTGHPPFLPATLETTLLSLRKEKSLIFFPIEKRLFLKRRIYLRCTTWWFYIIQSAGLAGGARELTSWDSPSTKGQQEFVDKHPSFSLSQGDDAELCSTELLRRPSVVFYTNCPEQWSAYKCKLYFFLFCLTCPHQVSQNPLSN